MRLYCLTRPYLGVGGFSAFVPISPRCKAAGAEQSFQKVRDAYEVGSKLCDTTLFPCHSSVVPWEVLSNDDKRREYDRQIAPPDRGPNLGWQSEDLTIFKKPT